MTDTPPILDFREVTTEVSAAYETGLWNISFKLLLLLERQDERLPLADAAEGLAAPVQGTVAFLGEDWQRMSADQAAMQRGRIGRVFEDSGWVSDMDVDENIILAQEHHTQRPEPEILDEALKLARLFGLPGLPRGRPGAMRRLDLRKAACIGAFLGQPLLILLDQPARGVYADLIAPLVNAVQSARRRGAALLWTTGDLHIWNNPGLRATTRAKIFGSQMYLMDSAA
jgi:phospholipid/cholesterol/gamma-HCH transport system ATP-binding protein